MRACLSGPGNVTKNSLSEKLPEKSSGMFPFLGDSVNMDREIRLFIFG